MNIKCALSLFLMSTMTVVQAHSSEDRALVMDYSKPAFFTPNLNIWQKAPNFLPPGAEMIVLEGDPLQPGPFTMRLKLPENYKLPAHWGPTDERITIITGKLLLGIGDKLDPLDKRNKILPPGSLARIPAKIHHYASTNEETIIQIHGQGPWGIMYVDPNEDPNPSPERKSLLKEPLQSSVDMDELDNVQ